MCSNHQWATCVTMLVEISLIWIDLDCSLCGKGNDEEAVGGQASVVAKRIAHLSPR